MSDGPPDVQLNRDHLRRRFERAAADFDGADFVHRATREGLLQRIEPLLIDARIVVDLGAATGAAYPLLKRRFKNARIVHVDIAHAMLRRARGKRRWISKVHPRGPAYLQADANALPFADASCDVVFCNLLLPLIGDPTKVLNEIARVLRKGGVFAFATLGPDSLQELMRAWRKVDNTVHVNRFADMHDLGDGLVRAGFSDPVLDVDRLAISYADPIRLFEDLTDIGGRNALSHRRASLTGKGRWQKLLGELDRSQEDGKLTLDLEVVFGHTWGSGPKQDPGNFRINADAIPRRRR